MATFLELCQDVRAESGVGGAGKPDAVTFQSGIYADIVRWTRKAWVDVQNEHSNWKFLHKMVEPTLTATSFEYSISGDLSITDFRDIDRDLCFIFEPDVTQRGKLTFIPYETYMKRYTPEAIARAARPTGFTITPGLNIKFNATPDKDYLTQLHYWADPQVLAADDDAPVIEPDLHDVIIYRALLKYAVREGAATEKPEWRAEYLRLMRLMETKYLDIPTKLQVAPLA